MVQIGDFCNRNLALNLPTPATQQHATKHAALFIASVQRLLVDIDDVREHREVVERARCQARAEVPAHVQHLQGIATILILHSLVQSHRFEDARTLLSMTYRSDVAVPDDLDKAPRKRVA